MPNLSFIKLEARLFIPSDTFHIPNEHSRMQKGKHKKATLCNHRAFIHPGKRDINNVILLEMVKKNIQLLRRVCA